MPRRWFDVACGYVGLVHSVVQQKLDRVGIDAGLRASGSLGAAQVVRPDMREGYSLAHVQDEPAGAVRRKDPGARRVELPCRRARFLEDDAQLTRHWQVVGATAAALRTRPVQHARPQVFPSDRCGVRHAQAGVQ